MKLTDRQREVLTKMNEGWELRRVLFRILEVKEASMIDNNKAFRFSVPFSVWYGLVSGGYIFGYYNNSLYMNSLYTIYELTDKGKEAIK